MATVHESVQQRARKQDEPRQRTEQMCLVLFPEQDDRQYGECPESDPPATPGRHRPVDRVPLITMLGHGFLHSGRMRPAIRSLPGNYRPPRIPAP